MLDKLHQIDPKSLYDSEPVKAVLFSLASERSDESKTKSPKKKKKKKEEPGWTGERGGFLPKFSDDAKKRTGHLSPVLKKYKIFTNTNGDNTNGHVAARGWAVWIIRGGASLSRATWNADSIFQTDLTEVEHAANVHALEMQKRDYELMEEFKKEERMTTANMLISDWAFYTKTRTRYELMMFLIMARARHEANTVMCKWNDTLKLEAMRIGSVCGTVVYKCLEGFAKHKLQDMDVCSECTKSGYLAVMCEHCAAVMHQECFKVIPVYDGRLCSNCVVVMKEVEEKKVQECKERIDALEAKQPGINAVKEAIKITLEKLVAQHVDLQSLRNKREPAGQDKVIITHTNKNTEP